MGSEGVLDNVITVGDYDLDGNDRIDGIVNVADFNLWLANTKSALTSNIP